MTAAAAKQLAARIEAATTATEMHAIADDAARTDLTGAEREGLQLRYESRYRLLWPRAFKAGGW